jgi:hypothetical protein
MMIEGKGLGNKRVNRVNVSLSNRYFSKLKRLSISCNMRWTTLAGLMIEMFLNDATLMKKIQDEYCTEPIFRVLPMNDKPKNYVIYGENQ